MNGFGLLSQLHDSGTVVSMSHTMHRGKLRDYVANGVIERTVSNLTAVDVNNRNLQEKCRYCSRQHFVSIPQQHNNVWRQRRESISKFACSSANLSPDVGSRVCMGYRPHLGRNVKPRCSNRINGVPEFG
ncbi:unannotated protein [freshwater metagenome]|uniref:Unannotated protein n=1 Tax=freshwater metagenome TaxID=449393 RepID=A0A6J6KIP3_9ZZZZ